jgi:hypothetical protein
MIGSEPSKNFKAGTSGASRRLRRMIRHVTKKITTTGIRQSMNWRELTSQLSVEAEEFGNGKS